jgi:hypothetical protein
LAQIQPSPVVQLKRAAAIAMRDAPGAGLAHIDAALAFRELANEFLARSAGTDIGPRLGRKAEAKSSYKKALALTQQRARAAFAARADSQIEIKSKFSWALGRISVWPFDYGVKMEQPAARRPLQDQAEVMGHYPGAIDHLDN